MLTLCDHVIAKFATWRLLIPHVRPAGSLVPKQLLTVRAIAYHMVTFLPLYRNNLTRNNHCDTSLCHNHTVTYTLYTIFEIPCLRLPACRLSLLTALFISLQTYTPPWTCVTGPTARTNCRLSCSTAPCQNITLGVHVEQRGHQIAFQPPSLNTSTVTATTVHGSLSSTSEDA